MPPVLKVVDDATTVTFAQIAALSRASTRRLPVTSTVMSDATGTRSTNPWSHAGIGAHNAVLV